MPPTRQKSFGSRNEHAKDSCLVFNLVFADHRCHIHTGRRRSTINGSCSRRGRSSSIYHVRCGWFLRDIRLPGPYKQTMDTYSPGGNKRPDNTDILSDVVG